MVGSRETKGAVQPSKPSKFGNPPLEKLDSSNLSAVHGFANAVQKWRMSRPEFWGCLGNGFKKTGASCRRGEMDKGLDAIITGFKKIQEVHVALAQVGYPVPPSLDHFVIRYLQTVLCGEGIDLAVNLGQAERGSAKPVCGMI